MRFFRRSDLDEFSINFGPSRPIHSPVHSEAGVAARVQTVIDVRNGLALPLGRRRAGSARDVRHNSQAVDVGRDRNRRRRHRRRGCFEKTIAVSRLRARDARQSERLRRAVDGRRRRRSGRLADPRNHIAEVRLAATGVARPMDVSREVENLSAQIEALKEAQVIEGAKAEALEQKLDQLGQEASGEDPAKTWEALDHLNDAVEKAAKEAAEAASARRERLDRAEALAEGLMAGGDQLDSKTMTEAMRTLGEMTREAVKENGSLAGDLSPETLEAIKSGSLKAEHLKDLSKALSQSKSALNQNLSKLSKSGMINPNALKGGAQANRRDNSGLARFLKENAEKMSIDEATLQWCAGKGGVDRGRGDAAMTWTDGSSEKDARFKEKVLPPSSVAGLNDSQLVGLSASAPTADTSGVAAHGALNSAASGGGSAYTQTILPRHRGAVRRYFDRPQSK